MFTVSRPFASALFSALLVSTGLAGIALLPKPALAVTAEEATGYITRVGNEALEILNGDAASAKPKLEAMFAREVDTDWVSKFVMGRSWRTLTPEQQSQYQAAYRQFLVEHYTSNFTEYTKGTTFKVTRATPQAREEQQVATEILRAGKPPIIAEYRVSGSAGHFKIVDVVVEGVSLITTQRQEFASVMQRHGFDYLLQQLHSRTQAAGGPVPSPSPKS